MPDDQRSYFQARAEEEIEAAQSATHPEAVRAHYLLAGYYLDLVHNPVAAACLGEALDGARSGSATPERAFA